MIAALINGQLSKTVSINSRGLNYGDGLFETINVVNGFPEFLDRHLERLRVDCDRLQIDCDLDAVRQDILSILGHASGSKHVVKVLITRAASGRGYKPVFGLSADRIVLLDTLPVANNNYIQSGVKLKLCNHRIGINTDLAGIKHLSRLENVMARSEWTDSNTAEGLVMDSVGHVIEGTMSNVFLVQRGELQTPSLARCGVAGIIRGVILEQIAPQLGLKTQVKDIYLKDILAADELFICNSLIGIWPVVAIGCHHKSIGKLTRTIQHSLTNRASERA
ncbi:MAG: aminodeoxychorismate lyase [Oceanicoccus sp.]